MVSLFSFALKVYLSEAEKKELGFQEKTKIGKPEGFQYKK